MWPSIYDNFIVFVIILLHSSIKFHHYITILIKQKLPGRIAPGTRSQTGTDLLVSQSEYLVCSHWKFPTI